MTIDGHTGEREPTVMAVSVFKLIWVNGTATAGEGIVTLTEADEGVVTVGATDETGADKIEWCL